MSYLWYLFAALAVGVFFSVRRMLSLIFPRKYPLAGRHVLVTGGSSGIGRSLATLAAKHGAHVTLVARDPAKLEAARVKVQAANPLARVLVSSIDVGDPAAVKAALEHAEQQLGPVHIAACCAGFALAQRFEEMSLPTYRRLMEVNYFGVVNVLHACVPSMKQHREGKIAIVSSLGGIVGLWGFAGYCGSKYALVGLAHTLTQELKPYNIGVTICYPPDTDTPGFEEENRTKPEETKLICATAGLFTPDQVAAQLLNDMMDGNINSTVGSEGFLMTTVGLGMGPITSTAQLVREVLLMPVFRLGVAFFHRSWDTIVRECMQKREMSKKSE